MRKMLFCVALALCVTLVSVLACAPEPEMAPIAEARAPYPALSESAGYDMAVNGVQISRVSHAGCDITFRPACAIKYSAENCGISSRLMRASPDIPTQLLTDAAAARPVFRLCENTPPNFCLCLLDETAQNCYSFQWYIQVY